MLNRALLDARRAHSQRPPERQPSTSTHCEQCDGQLGSCGSVGDVKHCPASNVLVHPMVSLLAATIILLALRCSPVAVAPASLGDTREPGEESRKLARRFRAFCLQYEAARLGGHRRSRASKVRLVPRSQPALVALYWAESQHVWVHTWLFAPCPMYVYAPPRLCCLCKKLARH